MSSPMQRFPILSNILDDGRAIVVGVNADEIWHGEDTAANPTGRANHALLITGIDETRGLVTLSDPGHPDGNNEVVPLDVFKEAWAAGENQLLVTDQPVTHDGVTTPGPVVVPVTLNANAPTTEFALAAGFDGGGSGDTHVVQRGETLWGIARSVYGDPTAYTKIAAANGISDPNSIVTGQRLIIPGAAGAGPTPPIIVEPVGHGAGAEQTSQSVASPAPPTPADGAGSDSPVVVEPVGHSAGAESRSQSVASPAPPTPADGAGPNSPIVVEPVGHNAGNGSADQPAPSSRSSSTANAVSSPAPAAGARCDDLIRAAGRLRGGIRQGGRRWHPGYQLQCPRGVSGTTH